MIDIAPPAPKQESLPPPERFQLPQPKRRVFSFRAPVFFLFAAVLLLLGAGVAHFFFASAVVTISPRARTLSLQEEIRVLPGSSQVDLENKTIPGKVLSQEVSKTSMYPASGTKIKETKSEGVIRVFNNQSRTQILVSTTRFLSEESMLFRSAERVTIPAGGFTDVKVAAAEPGEQYNIEPSNFSLPGLVGSPIYTLVYGKSFQRMSGGSKSEIKVVTGSDIEQAKAQIQKDLENTAREKIIQLVSLPYTLDENVLETRVATLDALVGEGAELEQVSVAGMVKASATVFQENDLAAVVQDGLKNFLEGEERLRDESITFTYELEKLSEGNLALSVSAQGTSYQHQDEDALRSRIQGEQKSAAFAILSRDETISQFQISLFPFWLSRIPADPANIRIHAVFGSQ